ncbi:MAG: type I restriction endonuclease subunit R [Chloroflexi bacterium]|nr:type I restriction endonuclease subunit R [Chloroflexota bacterium]
MQHSLDDFREVYSSQIPALQMLMALGYEYLSPAEALRLRGGSPREVVLTGVLEPWLRAHNRVEFRGESREFDDTAIQTALRRLLDQPIDGLVRTNERVYDLLTLGTSLDQTIDGDRRSFSLHYIDWQRPAANVFHVTEEFAVERARSHETRRPDIVCFVNGIPFAVIECKRPDLHTEGGLPYEEAVSQMIRNQGADEIPHLFIYAQLLLAISVHHGRYAATGTDKEFWATWREASESDPNGETHAARVAALVNTPRRTDQQVLLYDWRPYAAYARAQGETGPRLSTAQDLLLVSLLDPARLLELTYQFLVFDNGIKKVARYQQYFAVKATIDRVAQLNAQGERTGGVIWHTTGSGKSLTMVMLAKALALHPHIRNPRVILVTDRINLDAQIYNTFRACGKAVVQAGSGRHLIELVRDQRVDIIATVINKFEAAAREKISNADPNIFVLVDESHRGQFGLIHNQMRQVFPHGCYIGFTGTPLTRGEKTTAAQFGSFIHKYPMRQAVADQTVVPLLYEGRMVELDVNREQVDRWFERHTRDLNEDQKADLKRKMSRAEELGHVDQRIQEIAYDLAQHYRQNFQGQGFKAQLATSSKEMALKYKQYLDEIGGITSAIVISAPDTREGHDAVNGASTPEVQAFWRQMMQHYGSENAYNTEIINDFARAEGVELLIVVDKLLVGFDEPRNTVLYIDKPLRDHAILQAIARVNRVFPGKDFGYVIDYRGVLGSLNEAIQTYDALADYDPDDVAGTITDVAAEIEKLPQLHSDLWALFRGVDASDSTAMAQFLEPEDRRQAFYDALSAFARCLKVALSAVAFYENTPEAQVRDYKRDLKFFHNLRQSVKFMYAEIVDYRDYEQRIRKVLNTYVGAEGVKSLVGQFEVFDREQFDQAVEQLESPRARAEAILNHLKRTATEKMEQDPAFYRRFSQMIDETLNALRQGRMDQVAALEEAYDLRETGERGHLDSLPPQLLHYRDARAYYGVLQEALSGDGLSDDALADVAIQVEEIIEQNKVRDWRSNPDVQNAIWLAVEDYLYDLSRERGLALDGPTFDLIIAQVIDIARKR